MDFHNFFTIYVFEVKESIVDILTELRCLSDLDNPSSGVATEARGARAPSTPPGTTHEIHANPKTFFGVGWRGGGE